MSGLTNGQQAAIMTIALALIGVGAIGSSGNLASYGFPPIAGFVLLVLGIIGAAIKEGYGIASGNTPTPTPTPASTSQSTTKS